MQSFPFADGFQAVYKAAEEWGKLQARAQKPMRSYEDSLKSKKTVGSMVERKGDNKENKKKGNKFEILATVDVLMAIENFSVVEGN